MLRLPKTIEPAYRFLASKELAVALFLFLSIILIPGTFAKEQDIRLGWIGSIALGVMALNLFLCTVQRLRALSPAVIVLHAGTVLIMAGSVVSSFGFVATVNIYEGDTVNTVFRWDVQRDMPLGVDIGVRKVHREYYPVSIRVGVLRDGQKYGLYELKTGGNFMLDRYEVRAESIDLPAERLYFSILEGGRPIGTCDTEGVRNLPADFPFDFKLVAFRNARLKRVWADLVISTKSEIIAEGPAEVNSPLTWGKLSFYNTAMDTDDFGRSFAGIQITRDPGKPFVYFGFLVMGCGAALYFLDHVRRGRPQ